MIKRKGSALIFITALSGLLLLIAITAGVNAISDVSITNEEKSRTILEFACESGLNRAKAKIESSFNNNMLSNLEPDIAFQGTNSDDTGATPAEKAFDDENFESATVDYYSFVVDAGENNPDISVRYSITNGRDPGEDPWSRTQGFTTNKMRVEAVAFAPEYGWIGMTEDVWARRTSLFMYQIFFENDLEILPGPNFNLTGLIHTNEDLYLNAGNTLNIYTDSLTSAGDIYRGRLDKNSVGGTVNITTKDQNGNLVGMGKDDDSENTDWTDIAASNWSGTVKDRSLGASRQEAPDLKSFEPGGYYDTNAGISIFVDTSGAQTLYEITYNGSTVTRTSDELGGALAETEVYDYRENPSGGNPAANTPVKITNVDPNKLHNALGYYPDNGVIYMTRDDAVPDTDGDPYNPDPGRNVSGFKLVEGEVLPDATTFVSDLPVYVEGNFNLHTSDDPAIDTWKPCAVVSDAITLLSENWSDSESNWKDPAVDPDKSMPNATDTEFNLVLITGNVPTRTGQYSGGFENFPRFLESWSGKTVDISGGFIQLFRSKYSTGNWSYGSYYRAPNRDWKSEPRFDNLNDLPPEFVDMFPSAAISVIYSDWRLISRNESSIGSFNE